MKITVGQLKKVIHSQLAEAKTAKQGEAKKINEAVSGVNLEQPYSNLYIKGWGMDQNGNMRIIIGLPNDRGYSIQTNGALPNTHSLIRGKNNLTDEDLKVIGKEITDYVRLETSKESILHSRLKLKSVTESRISGEVKKINEATFTKLIKKLIVEESNDIKGIKLNEGTGNFYNKNATHIFAFGTDTEDNGDDDEYDSDQHQIDYEDQISYIIEELSKIPGFSEGEYDFDDNRNFSGRSLGAISVNISNKNDTGVQIICVARSGYYEGANLDWELKFTGPDGYDIDSPDDIPQRSYATKLQRAADALVKKVEKVYARCTTPYGVSARFSNGETMYHKIDGKKSK